VLIWTGTGESSATPTSWSASPTIKGKRISAELILGWLAQGWTHEQVLGNYPHITREDILPALAFASEILREEQCALIDQTAA
jgi:uncharacterized protein (DUF433 family)